MLDLRDPQARDGWHCITFVIATLSLLAIVARISYAQENNAGIQAEIARYSLFIIALAVIGRNFLIKAGPITLDATGSQTPDETK